MRSIKKAWKHYGLTVYALEDDDLNEAGEYAVGTETAATKAAARAVEDSLWAFKPEFLVEFLKGHNPFFRGMDETQTGHMVRVFALVQEKLSEDCAPLFRALIGGAMAAFVDSAIRGDGRGHFLASYDGKEQRSSDVEGLPRGRLAYRIN